MISSFLSHRDTYDGVRRVSGIRRDPAVSVKDLKHIYISRDPAYPGIWIGSRVRFFVTTTRRAKSRHPSRVISDVFNVDLRITFMETVGMIEKYRDPNTKSETCSFQMIILCFFRNIPTLSGNLNSSWIFKISEVTTTLTDGETSHDGSWYPKTPEPGVIVHLHTSRSLWSPLRQMSDD